MFRLLLGTPPDESQRDGAAAPAVPRFRDTPGVWLRLRLPDWAQVRLGPLDLYQWVGLLLAALASWAGARMTLAAVSRLVTWLLRRSGSALSAGFVASTLWPLTWVAAV